jgi:hypothetical protein
MADAAPNGGFYFDAGVAPASGRRLALERARLFLQQGKHAAPLRCLNLTNIAERGWWNLTGNSS